jgi:hypothetical protein
MTPSASEAKGSGPSLWETTCTKFETRHGTPATSIGEDIVKAIPEAEGQRPKLREVVRRNGHRTLHLYFLKKSTEIEKNEVLAKIKEWKASYENSDSKLYAVTSSQTEISTGSASISIHGKKRTN